MVIYSRDVKELIQDMSDIEEIRELIFQTMIDISFINNNEFVLDAGCGTGTLMSRLSRVPGYRGIIYCVDIEDEALEYCRKRAKQESIKQKIKFMNSTVSDLSFDENFFDVAFCGGVMHEVAAFGEQEVLKALEELIRVIKHNGRFVLYDLVKPGTDEYVTFNPQNRIGLYCLNWLRVDRKGQLISKSILGDRELVKEDKIHLDLLYEILWRVKKANFFEKAEEKHFFFSVDLLLQMMVEAGFREVNVVYNRLDNNQKEGLRRRLKKIGLELDEKYLLPHRVVLSGIK